MKTKPRQNWRYASSPENVFSRLLNGLTLTTALAGSIKTSVVGWSSSAVTWLKRRVQDLCSLCRLDTVRVRLHRLRSRLGIWGDIQITNLYLVRTRVRLRWDSAVRSVRYYVILPIKRRLRRALTQIRKAQKRGLLPAVAGMLLLALGAVLLVRGLMFSSSTIQ